MAMRMLIRLGVVVVLLAATVACDKVPLGAPSQAIITVSAAARSLNIGESTEITAFVAESGGTSVQNGTSVRFSTTLGTVDPVEVQTRNGLAITTLRAGNTSGVAQVRATSGSATGGGGTGGAGTPTNIVEVSIGAATVATLSLAASGTTLPSNGGVITLTALVADAVGNRVPGVVVAFTTTAGTLSSSNPTTDANGEAVVQLTTNRTATVTARTGAGDTARTGSAVINVATLNSLALTRESPVAFGSPVTVIVTPTVGASNVAPRVVVAWGDGASDDLGTVTATRSISHTYARAGTFTIVATATGEGEVVTASTVVVVNPRPAIGVSIFPSPNPAALGQAVTLQVTPSLGANTALRVVVNWGDGTSEDMGAVAAIRNVSHIYSRDGNFIITATATGEGDTATASAVVTVNPRPPLGVNIAASDTTPSQNTPSEFTATVTNEGTGGIASYVWRFVDNTTGLVEQETTTNGNRVTRVFTTLGGKTVTVTVNAADGRTATGQTQVVVVFP
jgi:hypothetical protein